MKICYNSYIVFCKISFLISIPISITYTSSLSSLFRLLVPIFLALFSCAQCAIFVAQLIALIAGYSLLFPLCTFLHRLS